MRSNLHGLADASWGISKTGWPEIFGRTKKPLLTVIFFPYLTPQSPHQVQTAAHKDGTIAHQ